MAICMAGIDHNKADLDTRSLFSLTSKRMALAYDAFLSFDEIEGCVILSTCNRMEIYLSVREGVVLSPVELLFRHLDVDRECYSPFFTEREDDEAIDHLFRLSAGLESQIVGEDQILTQVGDAVACARSYYATDNTLEVLFRLAVTAGKRVRTETDLSTADNSVIHTALAELKERGTTVEGKKCMVIGNGMMGKLSAQTLLEQGAEVTVTVRKYHSGVVDVPDGCKRIMYDERFSLLPSCDLVVSATSSPNFTLPFAELKELSVDHTIPLIDLAVPRDIAPDAASLSWAELYDIDSFHIDIKSEKFLRNLKKAEEVIAEEKDRFYAWYEGRDFVPRIQQLKAAGGEDVSLRMTPFFKHLDIPEAQKQEVIKEVEGASSRMLNHLLFGIRTKLSDRTFREVLDAMSDVLGE